MHVDLRVFRHGFSLTLAVVRSVHRGKVVQELAGVHLRLFTLESIARALVQHRFGDAMAKAAQYRIDLNYLVDFLGASFPKHAQEFVKQAPDDGAICDLLSALVPGSCIAPGGKYAFAAPSHFTSNTPEMAESANTEAEAVGGHRRAAASASRTSATAVAPSGVAGRARGGGSDIPEASIAVHPVRGGLEQPGAAFEVPRAVKQACRAMASNAEKGFEGPEVAVSTSAEPFPLKMQRSCEALRNACKERGGCFLRALIMSHLK
jgi:hypothetical protein